MFFCVFLSMIFVIVFYFIFVDREDVIWRNQNLSNHDDKCKSISQKPQSKQLLIGFSICI